jgi:transcriptional regulator with XRE-family HTH domain
MSNLGEKLILARKKKRLSRRELAELANVSPKMIYRYEVENADPSAAILARIAVVLGYSTDYFLGLADLSTETYRDEKLSEEEYHLVQSYRRGDIVKLLVIGTDRLRKVLNQPSDDAE